MKVSVCKIYGDSHKSEQLTSTNKYHSLSINARNLYSLELNIYFLPKFKLEEPKLRLNQRIKVD